MFRNFQMTEEFRTHDVIGRYTLIKEASNELSKISNEGITLKKGNSTMHTHAHLYNKIEILRYN